MASSALSFPSTAGKTCVHWNYTKASLQAPPLDFSFRGISFMQDFPDIMEKLLEYPLDIYWIDLSFNDLPSIDPVLTTYYNLRNLNLHGNSIQHLSEVDKLAVLPHLRNLTLHGNPIEEEKGYRSYVLSTLPQLKSFDFSGVTKLDRSTAAVWRRMNIKPKVIRKKRERY
ncbi:leucine-rich repeat-containing protein 51 isoform X5 [Ahaetulla prasina]|uniref:leucine-rich repeat-containing protein 51 isoform X5 n=1 Tax=Ahaetulla prasina TaxID=499056 RepID=UPI0026489A6B|nr:leucine-rich repeat-containing protein 51 isoform X5 [Ahaetulla prasina]